MIKRKQKRKEDCVFKIKTTKKDVYSRITDLKNNIHFMRGSNKKI